MTLSTVLEIISKINFDSWQTWALWMLSACLTLLWFYFKYQTNFEKLFAQLLGLFTWLGVKWEKAHIKHDIQWRMNNFIKKMDKKIPWFSTVKIDIDFYSEEKTFNPENFLNDGIYFVRAKKSSDPNRNFVNIAMTFIADNLLKDAKHQISAKQQSSIDLYVAKILLTEEKKEVINSFVSDFLQPITDDSKIKDYFNKFMETDRAGIFFPVFLQEMQFLWLRVFSHPKNAKIREEVASLINFLHKHAERRLGDDSGDHKFIWEFSKFAIMIVWKSVKVETGKLQAYSNYLKGLMDQKTESIYLIGNERIQDFINQVTPDSFLKQHWYSLYKKEKYKCKLRKNDWGFVDANTYLLLIRKENIDPYVLSSDAIK